MSAWAVFSRDLGDLQEILGLEFGRDRLISGGAQVHFLIHHHFQVVAI